MAGGEAMAAIWVQGCDFRRPGNGIVGLLPPVSGMFLTAQSGWTACCGVPDTDQPCFPVRFAFDIDS